MGVVKVDENVDTMMIRSLNMLQYGMVLPRSRSKLRVATEGGCRGNTHEGAQVSRFGSFFYHCQLVSDAV